MTVIRNATPAAEEAWDRFAAILADPDSLIDVQALAEHTGLSQRRLRDLTSPAPRMTTEAVRGALETLPEDAVITYGDLAAALGNPNGARAVGQIIANDPEITPASAARVVPNEVVRLDGVPYFRVHDARADFKGGMTRTQALKGTTIPDVRPGDGVVYVPTSAALTPTAAAALLAR